MSKKIIVTESQYQRLLLEMYHDMKSIDAEAEKADIEAARAAQRETAALLAEKRER